MIDQSSRFIEAKTVLIIALPFSEGNHNRLEPTLALSRSVGTSRVNATNYSSNSAGMRSLNSALGSPVPSTLSRLVRRLTVKSVSCPGIYPLRER